MQKFDHVPKKVLFTGGSGTGKTTLAEKLMRQERAKLKLVYDHDGQFASRFDHQPIYSAAELDAVVANPPRDGFIVYDPSTDFNGREIGKNQHADLCVGFQFFCDYVLSISKALPGRKLIYCDEVDQLTSNTLYPASLVAVLQTGRRYQIDAFLISSQPNTLHNRVRTQLTEVYTFLHIDKAALQFLTENQIPEEKIRGLGDHGWYYRHLRTGVVNSNVKSNVVPTNNDDTGKTAS